MFATLLAKPKAYTVYRNGRIDDAPDWLRGGPQTTSGEVVTEETARTVSVYFACMRNIAEDCGKLPIKLFRRLRPRGRERVTGHPAGRLVSHRPNYRTSPQVFWETIVGWAAGWGNAYAEIERNRNGEPVSLWLIHPSRVPRRKAIDDPYVVYLDSGQQVDIPPEDMLHVRGVGDQLVGYSVCELAAESLGLALATERFGAALFGNDLTIGVIITRPKDAGALSPQQIRDIRDQFERPHRGARNAHKPKILPDGMTVERMDIPPENAQFLETRSFQTVDICRWFRMPPHKVQHLENATFSNIEQQSIEYVTDTLLPWLIRLENECNLKLLGTKLTEDDPELYVKAIANGLMRGDSAARATFHRELFMIGAASPNDVRELEDLNPRDGGDEYFVPGNMIGSNGTKTGGFDPSTGKRNEAKTAMMPVFVEALERLCRREANAVGRAAKKYIGDKDAFSDWQNEFFCEHTQVARDTLGPPTNALGRLVGADLQALTVRLHAWIEGWTRGRMLTIEEYPADWSAKAAVELTDLVDGD